MVAQKPFWTEKPCSMNWTLLNFAGLAKGELKKKVFSISDSNNTM